MFYNEWTQGDLARELGFHQSNISRVIKGSQQLPQERREIAEELLKHVEDIKH